MTLTTPMGDRFADPPLMLTNKAVFLMTDGGTFNGKTVTKLGITKVAKIVL